MNQRIYSFLFILFLFLGSCSEKSDQLHPELVKIYLFDKSSDKNVFCFDTKLLANNELLVFGVGSNTDSKFDTDGRLYLQKIDSKGENVWNGFYLNQGGGFPSNIIQTAENEFVLFWTNNKKFDAITIKIGTNEPQITTTSIENITDFETTSIVYALAQKGGYYILGTAIDSYNEGIKNKIYVSRLDSQFAVIENVSQQEYSPQAFGILENEDVNSLKQFGKYFYMGDQTRTTIFFTAPFKDKMALKELGSTMPMYQDAKKWITGVAISPTYKISMIFTNPENISHIYLQKQVDISKPTFDYNSFSQKDSLIGFNTSSPVIIKYLSNKKMIVAGTSSQGQMVIHSFDENEKPLKINYLGQAYPYKITQVLEMNDKKTIAIIGTTMVKNTYQRIFLVEIPIEQLFN